MAAHGVLEFVGKEGGLAPPKPYHPATVLPIEYATIEIYLLDMVLSTTTYIRRHTKALKATEWISARDEGDAWGIATARAGLVYLD